MKLPMMISLSVTAALSVAVLLSLFSLVGEPHKPSTHAVWTVGECVLVYSAYVIVAGVAWFLGAFSQASDE